MHCKAAHAPDNSRESRKQAKKKEQTKAAHKPSAPKTDDQIEVDDAEAGKEGSNQPAQQLGFFFVFDSIYRYDLLCIMC